MPDPEIEAHIVETVEMLLDPLREAWESYCNNKGFGSPAIRINSGYRSRKLNKLVAGPSTSAHCYGYAFDLVPLNGCMKEFKAFCRDFLSDKDFDQLISRNENSAGVPDWIHVCYKHPNQVQRKQYLSMIDGKFYPMTK